MQPDPDGDGVDSGGAANIIQDNCPDTSNANQADSDGDGIGDACDDNNDNDERINSEDACPLDNTEIFDNDGDVVLDINGNVIAGACDNTDRFPDDPNEWADTDFDFIGNNSDSDDDNDGYGDAVDIFPLDANEWLDTDDDGVGDNSDPCYKSAINNCPSNPLVNNVTFNLLPWDRNNDGVIDTFDDLYGKSSIEFVSGDYTPTVTAEAEGEEGLVATQYQDGNGGIGVKSSNINDWKITQGDASAPRETVHFSLRNTASDQPAFIGFSGINISLNLPSGVTPENNQITVSFESNDNEFILGSGGFSSALSSSGFSLTASDGLNDKNTEFRVGSITFDVVHFDGDDDGVFGENDVFPFTKSEHTDTDGDGIGNNADTDDDNDGILDENDGCPLDPIGILDSDSDGVCDPSDAFPLDATESIDTDDDGIGNNADTDDDNDNVEDNIDIFPLDATESIDTDDDGIGNNADTDDDNDGVDDASDAFPLDPTETLDTDGDEIGNNDDNDDDNDGVEDILDDFPLDPNESVDTDNDGIPDRLDTDRDGDGISNGFDTFPYDPSEYADSDGDGIGDKVLDSCPLTGPGANCPYIEVPLSFDLGPDCSRYTCFVNNGVNTNNIFGKDELDFPQSGYTLRVTPTPIGGVGKLSTQIAPNQGLGVATSLNNNPNGSNNFKITDGEQVNFELLHTASLTPVKFTNISFRVGPPSFSDDNERITLIVNDNNYFIKGNVGGSGPRLIDIASGVGANDDWSNEEAYNFSLLAGPAVNDATTEFRLTDVDVTLRTYDSDLDGYFGSDDRYPLDTDNDREDNIFDTDDDNDGVEDNVDAFPLDASESIDSDSDGVGDNADAFPFNASETTDSDEDSVGDNSDNCPSVPNGINEDNQDTDGDLVGDACDDAPDNPSVQVLDRIKVMGVDGPIANGIFFIYKLDDYLQNNFSSPVAQGVSDSIGFADDLMVAYDSGKWPFCIRGRE